MQLQMLKTPVSQDFFLKLPVLDPCFRIVACSRIVIRRKTIEAQKWIHEVTANTEIIKKNISLDLD
jgi:hypothetical protein